MIKKRFILTIVVILVLSILTITTLNSQKSNYKEEVCYSCFWNSGNEFIREELINKYSNANPTNNYTKAELKYTLGRMTENQTLICDSINDYENSLNEHDDKFPIYEQLFFLSKICKNSKAPEYLNALIALSDDWKKDFYENIETKPEDITTYPLTIEKELNVPENFSKIILGKSFIKIKNNSIIGIQIERTTRDWYSGFIKEYPNEFDADHVIDYHEGRRLQNIMDSNESLNIVPLTNAIVIKKDNMWWATDENGVFRFNVLEDKVIYPTSKCFNNICILEDTHGISMLVPQAINNEADLVLGCGDGCKNCSGKMAAAYYLSQKGIDVHFPADRFIGQVLGHNGKGTLLGTAPIKGGIIGNQSIEIAKEELITIQDINSPKNVAQYYDAPTRYFKALEKYVKLNTQYIVVDDINKSSEVVNAARETNSHVVAIRIYTEGDYTAVKEWLEENSNNRAIFFHSSLYPYMEGLFDEFEKQTSFGDPRPQFK